MTPSLDKDEIPWEQQALNLVIATVQEAMQEKPAEQQQPLQMALMTLRGFLAASRSNEDERGSSPEPFLDEIPPNELSRFQHWGAILRTRREASGLSRKLLSELSGVPEAALQRLEEGTYAPSQMALLHLLSVPQLKLETSDLPWETSTIDPNLALNCWLAPGFDPVKMVKELSMQVNGNGGHIEQSYLYMDHMSAAHWCAIAEQKDYDAMQSSMPLEKTAARILRTNAQCGLDVVALGPGSARNEVRLVKQLMTQSGHADLRLYLLDISQPLLSVAYRHAAEVLADNGGAVFAIQGNFHHLPRYGQLLYSPRRAHRRRIITMLGHTFSNLENELRFMRNSLCGFATGDLLVMDFRLAYTSSCDPDEIYRKDPTFASRRSTDLSQRRDKFLAGPFRRYGADQVDVEISPALDLSCAVPGSYGVDLRARVRGDGADREFSVYYSRRYEPNQLLHALRREGWETVESWEYGGDSSPCLLVLLRKLS
ncbi:MAG TPA: helix-turn-helix transcriptional regulator [Pseudomonadota bacterium]|nr:helix-turn-helix transcriptional regulator [Pseudomonadota bacterium]